MHLSSVSSLTEINKIALNGYRVISLKWHRHHSHCVSVLYITNSKFCMSMLYMVPPLSRRVKLVLCWTSRVWVLRAIPGYIWGERAVVLVSQMVHAFLQSVLLSRLSVSESSHKDLRSFHIWICDNPCESATINSWVWALQHWLRWGLQGSLCSCRSCFLVPELWTVFVELHWITEAELLPIRLPLKDEGNPHGWN